MLTPLQLKHQPVYVNVADLSFRLVNAIIISVALALGLLFVTVMPQRDMRTSDTDAIEFALLLLLMLMVTPLSFGYFYSWLMLPFAVVTQQTLARKRVPDFVVDLAGASVTGSRLGIPTGRATLRKYIFRDAAAVYRTVD